MLDKIAEERDGSIKLVKINIDDEPELAGQFGVSSIPTMILFENGEASKAVIGAQPKSMLEKSLGLETGE